MISLVPSGKSALLSAQGQTDVYLRAKLAERKDRADLVKKQLCAERWENAAINI